MKKTALIMAGGKGERFWPKSRTSLPKQFLSLTDDPRSMLQLTVDRILPLVDIQDIFIATNSDYKELVLQQLPELPPSNVICEPVGRNTAPCIGLGAVHIAHKYEDATMFVLPSDHLIKDNESFIKILGDAAELANSGNNLITLGITPNYPETGYGYIKYDTSSPASAGYRVEKFVEKPNIELAAQYLDEGCYLWNSGMFIWNVSTILRQMELLISETYQKLKDIQAAIGTEHESSVLEEIFPTCKSESVDYAIMEHAANIFTIPSKFGWDDVGSWLALERHNPSDEHNNIKRGTVVALDTENCIIDSTDKLVAALGIKDLIIVNTEDSLLICSKDRCNDIRQLLNELKSDTDLNSYL